MAHFRGTLQGNRGGASRLGTKDSDLHVTANGWDSGVTVLAYEENGVDYFRITLTGGSGYRAEPRNLGTFYRKGRKIVKKGYPQLVIN